MARIVFVVAPNYRDPELDKPKGILEGTHEVAIASTQTGTLNGAEGGSVESTMLVSGIDPNAYDGIVVVGGPGMYAIIHGQKSGLEDIKAKVSAFNSARKLVAAICIGPVALAKAGILTGKKATTWTDPAGTENGILEGSGATLSEDAVVRDGNIITANGPAAAQEFGNKIAEYFSKGETETEEKEIETIEPETL